MPCLLNYFPMEILHTIFDYLTATDLLRGFHQINSNIDTVLHSYTRIQLNGKSMKKSAFRFICEHIFPDQVRSLILVDDEQTPGQIKLFTFLLPLIKFNSLEVITINQIDDANLLCLMMSHLENHPKLQSLIVNCNSMVLSKKNSRFIADILVSLSSLTYLHYTNSSTLAALRKPLLKLTHLTINSCTFTDLKIILPFVPNLVYLKILVPYSDSDPFTLNQIPSCLDSLIIDSQRWILFDELDRLLSLTKSLKSFVLRTAGDLSLIDGQRWETLIKTKLPYLRKLALDLTTEENNMTRDAVLTPFQSAFWTNEKHWQMACLISTTTESCVRLFSVPHFSPTSGWYPPEEGFYNYSLVPFSFNDTLIELRMAYFSLPIVISTPFKYVRTLSLEGSMENIDQLTQVIHVLSVHHLILKSHAQCTSLYDLLKLGSNIRKLTVHRLSLMQLINSFSANEHTCEQINELYVPDSIESNDIDQICHTFTKLEYISLYVNEQNDAYRILNGFHNLNSAIIRWSPTSKSKSSPSMNEYLTDNHICTDGAYSFHKSSLNVWMD